MPRTIFFHFRPVAEQEEDEQLVSIAASPPQLKLQLTDKQ